MKELRYRLFIRLSYFRDSTPSPLTEIIDWIRYELLYDPKDNRHNYE